ncbi:MAG: hypothetical protein GF308_19185 [Candidatus Heimdallarchaeota archaeon]|nr:hypothetical protein [Candidatus Heimdallarchaeota archaeon]
MTTNRTSKVLSDMCYSLEKALQNANLYGYKYENSYTYKKAIQKRTKIINLLFKICGIPVIIAFVAVAFLLIALFLGDYEIKNLLVSVFGLFAVFSIAFILVDGLYEEARKFAKFLLKQQVARKSAGFIYDLDPKDERDLLAKQTLDFVFENEFQDKMIFAIFSEISTAVLLKGRDSVVVERIKRLVFTIISGNFVLESLELQTLVTEPGIKSDLLEVLGGIATFIENFRNTEGMYYLRYDFDSIISSITNVQAILRILDENSSNKEFSTTMQELATKINEQLEDRPTAKTKIKISKNPLDGEKDSLLSSVVALSSEMVEIRTKAGTYYTQMSHFDQRVSDDIRELELLTDKELKVKIEVFQTTLDMLDKDETLASDEKERLKEDFLKQLFAAQQTLDKRTGSSKTITCPQCKKKTSMIKRTCNNCGADLPFCMVCLNAIGLNEEIKICPHCQNIAHVEHFNSWLEKAKHCPICKKRLQES